MKSSTKATIALSIIFTVAACGAFHQRKSDHRNPETPSDNQAPVGKNPPGGEAVPAKASPTPTLAFKDQILGHWKTPCFQTTPVIAGVANKYARINEIVLTKDEISETERVYTDSTCSTLESESGAKSTYVLGDNDRNIDLKLISATAVFYTAERVADAKTDFPSSATCPLKTWVAGQAQTFPSINGCGLDPGSYTVVELKDGKLFMGDIYDLSSDGTTAATRITKLNSAGFFLKQN